MNDDLKYLHDAVLEELEVRWAHRETSAVFRLEKSDGAAVALVAANVTSLHLSRTNPWGPTNAVNEAQLEGNLGQRRITVEMQSGDVIVIEAREFRLA